MPPVERGRCDRCRGRDAGRPRSEGRRADSADPQIGDHRGLRAGRDGHLRLPVRSRRVHRSRGGVPAPADRLCRHRGAVGMPAAGRLRAPPKTDRAQHPDRQRPLDPQPPLQPLPRRQRRGASAGERPQDHWSSWMRSIFSASRRHRTWVAAIGGSRDVGGHDGGLDCRNGRLVRVSSGPGRAISPVQDGRRGPERHVRHPKRRLSHLLGRQPLPEGDAPSGAFHRGLCLVGSLCLRHPNGRHRSLLGIERVRGATREQ